MLASLVPTKRVRLDQLLVERGLAPSRARAQSLILFDPGHSWDDRIQAEQFRY